MFRKVKHWEWIVNGKVLELSREENKFKLDFFAFCVYEIYHLFKIKVLFCLHLVLTIILLEILRLNEETILRFPIIYIIKLDILICQSVLYSSVLYSSSVVQQAR